MEVFNTFFEICSEFGLYENEAGSHKILDDILRDDALDVNGIALAKHLGEDVVKFICTRVINKIFPWTYFNNEQKNDLKKYT